MDINKALNEVRFAPDAILLFLNLAVLNATVKTQFQKTRCSIFSSSEREGHRAMNACGILALPSVEVSGQSRQRYVRPEVMSDLIPFFLVVDIDCSSYRM